MKKLFVIISAMFLGACVNMPYKDDIGFLVSAQANSAEFPIYINGVICKDMDGNPGLCSKRIGSSSSLTIHFDPQSYPYDLSIACTSPLIVPGATVPAGQPFDLTIQPTQFPPGNGFICIGEIFPQDRSQPISAKWEVRVVIFDSNYVGRERMFTVKQGKTNYLVIGQYAKNSWVYDNQKWSNHSKTTVIKLKGDPATVQAYSESLQGRFNYFNFAGPVNGN